MLISPKNEMTLCPVFDLDLIINLSKKSNVLEIIFIKEEEASRHPDLTLLVD